MIDCDVVFEEKRYKFQCSEQDEIRYRLVVGMLASGTYPVRRSTHKHGDYTEEQLYKFIQNKLIRGTGREKELADAIRRAKGHLPGKKRKSPPKKKGAAKPQTRS